MALKTVLESLDGVEDAVKAFYTETDGSFVLQIEGVDAHPEVANLKSAFASVKADREKIREERDAAKALAGSIPKDFDAEKWAQLKDGKPDQAALLSLRQELEADRDEWKGKAEAATETARLNAIDRDLTDALTGVGVTNPMFAKAARGMLASSVKVDDKGAVFAATDMGDLDLDEYVKRWAAGDGKDFVTPPKGGGAKPGDAGTASKKWGEMSSGEKTRLHKENPEEYQRVKAAG